MVFVFMGHATVFYVVENYVHRFIVMYDATAAAVRGLYIGFSKSWLVYYVVATKRRHTEMMKNIYIHSAAYIPPSGPAALNSSPKSVNRVRVSQVRSRGRTRTCCSRHRMDATRGAITWSGT